MTEVAAAPTGRVPAPALGRWVLEPYDRFLPREPARLPDRDVLVILYGGSRDTAEPFAKACRARGLPSAIVRETGGLDPRRVAAALLRTVGDRKAVWLVSLAGLDLGAGASLTPEDFHRSYLKAVRPLFLAVRCLRAQLDRAGGGVLTLIRADGVHGAVEEDAASWHPLAGALSGLTKAVGKELLRTTARTVDFDPRVPLDEIAGAALAELGRAGEPPEIGYRGGRRWALRLRPAPAPAGPALSLNAGSVVVVTGGGRGLGAECAKELARRCGCRLFLIGRTRLDSDAAASSELTKNIEAMRSSGSQVAYLRADLADADSLGRAIAGSGLGRLAADLVLHAAGIEESRFLQDKTPEEFDEVFKAKAHGAVHLLNGLPGKPGQRWLLFSSRAGRFGNAKLADYAAANDFLAKLAVHLRGRGLRATAIDLPAFSDIGMVARRGLAPWFRFRGLDVLSPSEGVRLILEEALGGDGKAEVLFATERSLPNAAR